MRMYQSHFLPLRARGFFSAFAMVLLVFSSGNCGLAQSIQGSIVGTVQDKAGAVVPNATLTLENLDEGSTRTTNSSANGDYKFLDAKAGRYSLLVESAGF